MFVVTNISAAGYPQTVGVTTHATMPSARKTATKFARRPFQPGTKLNAAGSTMRRIRSACGWTQDQVAAKCQIQGWDIDRVIIAKIESRIRAVSDWELLKLCQVLAVTPNELLNVEPLPKNADELLRHLKSGKRKGLPRGTPAL